QRPWASAKTMAKEYVKHGLARFGGDKYAMHGANDLVRPVELRDGQRVWEFMRCNPHFGGVWCGDTAGGSAGVLATRFLDRLVARGGICILYTHLGKIRRIDEPFELPTRRAFELLAEYFRAGKLLVTTTRRLLGYRMARDTAHVGVGRKLDRVRIALST